jgi:CCR4-NOT transcription complex subunit 11
MLYSNLEWGGVLEMSISIAFWKNIWEALGSTDDSDSPEANLRSARYIVTAELLNASKLNDFSLISISWAAYILCTSDIETASLLSEVSPSFEWKHALACLVLLEAACSCANACSPSWNESGEGDDSGYGVLTEKTKSPFFPLLVQGALSALHQATESTWVDGGRSRQLARATILEFVEVSVLPDMLGKQTFENLERDIATGSISDDVRARVDEAVQLWTSKYAYEDRSPPFSPLLTLSSAVKDESHQQDIRKLLAAQKPFDRIAPSELLEIDCALRSVRTPFARPLPPPSLPLVGYDEDDFDTVTSAERNELLDFLHAELIWCTPVCNRLMLLPDDEDEDKEANEIYRQVLELLQQKAFVKPLAPIERRQVIELLSSSDHADRLILEAGLSPKNLPLLVEFNPLVAHECLLRVLQTEEEEEKNEYLSSLVGMDMSLHSMEVVNRLATHYIGGDDRIESSQQVVTGSSKQLSHTATNQKPILHPEYIHLFIGSCIASCENIQDRHAQNRLVRLVCVFIQSLLRNKIVEREDIYFEVQSFCVEFSRIREASSLFKSLKQQSDG